MEEADARVRAELALIERATAGDHEAFRRIVQAYEARLLAYLAHMLGDSEAARDIAQETFLAAYRALSRWHPPDGARAGERAEDGMCLLAPWLYRIATNRALSLLRATPPVARQ